MRHLILFLLLSSFSSLSVAANLLISTGGEGPQTATRDFQTKADTDVVTVRFRFITSEIPGGFFGTAYNDYFSVRIQDSNGGVEVSAGSMNGLGLGAFSPNGTTDWTEVTLNVAPQSNVRVTVLVANVGDGAFDSSVEVDYIEESKLSIQQAMLLDIDDGPLDFLSSSQHTYFGGTTPIHGTIAIGGFEQDTLSDVSLEVIQGGAVVATAPLSAAASGTLLTQFGSNELLEISSPTRLFDLPSSNGINVSSNGSLSLRIRAETADGNTTTKDMGTVQILKQYTGANRYGNRDAVEGGDDWMLPSIESVVTAITGQTYGDFSNMHGGAFPPHGSHRSGNDVDGHFIGYNSMDQSAAQTILGHLNSSVGSRIVKVFATFPIGGPFANEIAGVTLNDGRAATDVIQPVGGHATHYHWRIQP